MTPHEERQQLMQMARDLATERHTLLTQVSKMYNVVISKLVQAGDDLLAESMKTHPDVKGGHATPITAEDIAEHEAPSGRVCSHCKEAGHNVRTCPNLHKPKPTEPKVKHTRKPVSPERKAQLVENLKKARAARKKK